MKYWFFTEESESTSIYSVLKDSFMYWKGRVGCKIRRKVGIITNISYMPAVFENDLIYLVLKATL